jgi:hypothetical protein
MAIAERSMMRVLRHKLSLAAAPTFALMALLNGIHPSSNAHLLCSAASLGLPWTGMTAMYLVMGVFHLGPWLNLSDRCCDNEYVTPQCTAGHPIR